MTAVVVALVAAACMEPAAALVHRHVMHGSGWGWHRSHHAAPRGRVEANDLFPVVFAAATIVVIAVGTAVAGLGVLVWVGAGVTAYGAAYLVVHDLCIHGRAGRAIERGRYLRWVRGAHRIHHLYGREPYGFLFPIVPRELRDRAARAGAAGDGRRNAAPTVATLRAVDSRARRENTS